MRTILRRISAATRDYRELPFFDFLGDDRHTARERLAWVPCVAPFIMDFGDLNRYVLRDESSRDPYQVLVNRHTYEDDHHWPWYLEDLERLGHGAPQAATDWLRTTYDDRRAVTRLLGTRLAHLVLGATPLERLVVIEAVEATGNVLFTATARLARLVEQAEGIELRYLGDFHLALESGHAMGGDDHRALAAIELDDVGRARCVDLVDRVFGMFEAWVAELHAYALAELPIAA